MNESILDHANDVRQGEELPLEDLQSYLAKVLPDPAGTIEVKQFPRGYSNLTYLLNWGDTPYVLRRPPFGAKIKTAHDMGREFRVLSALVSVFPRVPAPVHYCEDEAIIGAPFYLMTRVKGVILRDKPPRDLNLNPELMQRLSNSFIDLLVELHGIDLKATGLIDFGKPEGYTERQVKGWARRYLKAKTDEIGDLQQVASWLSLNQPLQSTPTFIHNDFKYDNLVLKPDDLSEVVAILDWEMATVGEPLMDLGMALAYWVEPGDPKELRLGLTHLPGNLSRMELATRYARQRDINIDQIVFYYAFGLFKLAVIAQQIYARFKHGHTKDPRFGALIHAVKACGRLAATAIEHDRIHDLH